MLQISDEAKTMLKEALDDEASEPGQMYRLMVVDDQLALGIGGAEEGDIVYEQEGTAVLATPEELAQNLNSTIDVDNTAEGPRLVLVAA
jgi:hypothetical protein